MNFEKYEKFLEVVQDDIRKIFDYQKEYIFCKKGCSHCCKRGDFPMSKLEFSYLNKGFENLDEELKSQIKEKMEKIKEENQDSYACPFLINDSCSVYDYRPIVCRSFGVLTEDSKGNPSFPFCSTMGLNFSQLYDEETQKLYFEFAVKKGFKILPRVFRLNNKVIMNVPLAKELEIDFGESKRMKDFF